jgi:hypothetical protein
MPWIVDAANCVYICMGDPSKNDRIVVGQRSFLFDACRVAYSYDDVPFRNGRAQSLRITMTGVFFRVEVIPLSLRCASVSAADVYRKCTVPQNGIGGFVSEVFDVDDAGLRVEGALLP